MAGFLLKRLLQAAFVVVVVTLIVSFAVRLTGDPALMIASGATEITEADLARIREGLGLNQPFLTQYLHTLSGLFTWDFGNSFLGGTPVATLIGAALPATLALAFCAMAVSIVISIPLGIWAAVHKGKWADQLIRIVSLVGLSFPNFWLATMMVLLFSITLKWLPPSGMTGPASFIMPAATLGIILTATNVRLVRTSMLEVLNSQYIMVARAKGLPERKVILRHALKPAMLPVISYLGPAFVSMITGSVVIDMYFSTGGIGKAFVDSALNRDYAVMMGVTILVGALTIMFSLVVDIMYAWIDPKIRY